MNDHWNICIYIHLWYIGHNCFSFSSFTFAYDGSMPVSMNILRVLITFRESVHMLKKKMLDIKKYLQKSGWSLWLRTYEFSAIIWKLKIDLICFCREWRNAPFFREKQYQSGDRSFILICYQEYSQMFQLLNICTVIVIKCKMFVNPWVFFFVFVFFRFLCFFFVCGFTS